MLIWHLVNGAKNTDWNSQPTTSLTLKQTIWYACDLNVNFIHQRLETCYKPIKGLEDISGRSVYQGLQ